MSQNFKEYVAYLDSHNADPKAIPSDNSTNDVIIPCRFPNRINVAQISLGSLELPLTQYNIESDWNELYFDEGIDLYIIEPQDESIVQLVISENGTEYVAQLPPRLNPVISIDPTAVGTTSAIFTTQYPHCLHLRGLFNWGEPMKLIDTPIVGDPMLLTAGNTSLTILSDTTFQLDWGSPSYTFTDNGSGFFGYVTTPSIPSPVYLAQIVTAALQEAIPNHWRVTYDSCTGKFKLCWIGSGCDARTSAPAILVTSGNNSLAHILGFGCASVVIPLPDFNPPADPYNLSRQGEQPPTSYCVESVICSPCRSKIEIDPGNYSPDGLMVNISRQLNRFYFDPGCSFDSTEASFFYSTQCGECKSFTIPNGMYSPDQFAAYLQSQISAEIPSMTVTWNIDSGQFIFSADTDFGLEFNANTSNGSTIELAFRLGFYPISYRNNNTYSSVIPFYHPTKGCCGTSIPTRNLSYVYNPLLQAVLNNQKRFVVEISKTRAMLIVTAVLVNLNGTVTITTTVDGNEIAHGFQVLDVVEVTVNYSDNTSATYELTVTEVNDYNQFTAELGSIDGAAVFTPADPTVTSICVRLSGAITTNLYFSCLNSDILAMTLGFNKCDFLWDPVYPTTWIAPAMYSLDFPTYVLVELTQPTGSTHNMHAWNKDAEHTDTLTNVLAKVILYPQFRMERSFPFHMAIPDLRIINRVQIRILNPDHSLYKLHNRNFSFTLTFHAVEKSINQACY